jgi:hypothetical protein
MRVAALVAFATIGAALLAWWAAHVQQAPTRVASPPAAQARATSSPPQVPPAAKVTAEAAANASYVGSAVCGQCHEAAFAAWRTSQHAVAMQSADAHSLRGNFNGAKFSDGRIESKFFKRDGKFFVRTDGPNGALTDYEIAYTFGVDPLQQYLIPFTDGRLQALSIAWDTRARGEGGQRWFHLYPGQAIDHGDPALDGQRTELELHVGRMPRDGVRQELRRDDEPLRDALARARCRMRGVPWSGVAACRVDARAGRRRRHEQRTERTGRAPRRAQRRHVAT